MPYIPVMCLVRQLSNLEISKATKDRAVLCSVLHSGDIPLSLTSLAIAVGHGCYTGLPHNMVGEELARELYGVFVDQLSLYRVNYKAYKLVKTNRPYIGSLP